MLSSYISYKRLTDIRLAPEVKPYRGSTNRFPIYRRKDSYKYFMVEEIDGEVCYKIFNRYAYRREEVLQDDPSSLRHNPSNTGTWISAEDGKEYRHVRIRNELGIVRPDNTFEYTRPSTGIGHRWGISDINIVHGDRHWYRGAGYSKKRGGLVYCTGAGSGSKDDQSYTPIFEGMRVNIDTGILHKDSKYTVVGRKVNRTRAKKIMGQFDDFIIMSAAMSHEVTYKILLDMVLPHLVLLDLVTGYHMTNERKQPLIKKALSMRDESPLEAFAMLCAAHDIHRIWDNAKSLYEWKGEGKTETSFPIRVRHDWDGSLSYRLLMAIFRRTVLLANPSAFDEVRYEAEEYYPSTKWGYKVYVGEKEVNQYK